MFFTEKVHYVRIPVEFAGATSIYGTHYHLEGDVTTDNGDGGPGHVSGDSSPPPMVMALA